MRERRSAVALLIFALLLAFVLACGLSLEAEEPESEIFRQISVEGDLSVGSTLRLILDYEQPYAATLIVDCDLRDAAGAKVQDLLRNSLPANPEGSIVGVATPVLGTFEAEFEAPSTPGRYTIFCLTVEDPANTFQQEIVIQPADSTTETSPAP